jgi:ABC-type Fe3+-hydroxamate transport system substrate-binding protein
VSVTYKSAPKRAVTNDINTTEDMLALGLEPHMVGTFAAVGDGPADAPAIPAVYQAGFKKVRDAPSYLSKFGIKMLVLAESCAHVQSGTSSVSINETYQDLRNLGEIFNVRARAQQVISGMQAEVAAARAKIAGLKPVKVFGPVGAGHRAGPVHADGADQPRRRDKHLRLAQAELDVSVVGAGCRRSAAASSSTTTAPRRSPRRRSSWRRSAPARTSLR